MILINKNLCKNTTTIFCEERFVVVKILNYLLINIHFPCSGSTDRLCIYENLLSDIEMWRDRYSDCKCVIAGDFNCVDPQLLLRNFVAQWAYGLIFSLSPSSRVAHVLPEL